MSALNELIARYPVSEAPLVVAARRELEELRASHRAWMAHMLASAPAEAPAAPNAQLDGNDESELT